MKKQPLRATGWVVAGVVAGGILTGTLVAHAADDIDDREDAAASGTVMRTHHRGPGGPGGPGGEDLAKALGISEDKLQAAFEEVRKEHTAERRDALGDRLDAAVEDGKLTTADKASVLKAFDAGVLGVRGATEPSRRR